MQRQHGRPSMFRGPRKFGQRQYGWPSMFREPESTISNDLVLIDEEESSYLQLIQMMLCSSLLNLFCELFDRWKRWRSLVIWFPWMSYLANNTWQEFNLFPWFNPFLFPHQRGLVTNSIWRKLSGILPLTADGSAESPEAEVSAASTKPSISSGDFKYHQYILNVTSEAQD